MAELDEHGAVLSRFTYADKATVPSLMEREGSVYRLVSDHVGSVRLVIDVGTDQIVQRLNYDAWGNLTGDSTNIGFQPFAFAGGLYDHDTKLVRFGARDYDSSIGRGDTRNIRNMMDALDSDLAEVARKALERLTSSNSRCIENLMKNSAFEVS